MIVDVLPATNKELRQAIYSGNIFRLPASQNSLSLVERVLELIDQQLGKSYHQVHLRMPNEAFFKELSLLRQNLAKDETLSRLLAEIVSEAGFDRANTSFDALRLRAVVPFDYESPNAVKAYSLHRDTWFGNSQSQINWWLPLQDIDHNNSFAFYPDYFSKAVVNDSHLFDYDLWSKKVGFGNSMAKVEDLYPTAQEKLDLDCASKFNCRAGDVVLFSAAHLHQTCPNLSNLVRYSLDFRTVDLDDHEKGLGAMNADNKSKGSSLVDYKNPAELRNLSFLKAFPGAV